MSKMKVYREIDKNVISKREARLSRLNVSTGGSEFARGLDNILTTAGLAVGDELCYWRPSPVRRLYV